LLCCDLVMSSDWLSARLFPIILPFLHLEDLESWNFEYKLNRVYSPQAFEAIPTSKLQWLRWKFPKTVKNCIDAADSIEIFPKLRKFNPERAYMGDITLRALRFFALLDHKYAFFQCLSCFSTTSKTIYVGLKYL
jgi:hypothetical protein